MTDKKEKAQIDCEIIQDLLPLYHDGVVSEKTGEAIRDHLKQCPCCNKEYEILCADLPIETTEPSTKKQFINMVRHHKRKQLFISILSAVLACLLLVGAYWGQMQFPISNVPDNEISVQRVYRYETDEGYKFFVLYSTPPYNYTTGDISVKSGEDGDTLVMNIKKPLLTGKNTEIEQDDNIWVYECGYESGDNGAIIFQDFSFVEFGGHIVWDRTEIADDKVPDYVYAYEEYTQPGGGVQYWTVSSEDGYVEAGYYEGYFIRWDLDGNVLYDSRTSKGE